MIFDPDILTRLMTGDASALTEPVEFDDGTTKPLAQCTKHDLAVMNAWMKYKNEEATIRLAELPRHLTVVPETALDWLSDEISGAQEAV